MKRRKKKRKGKKVKIRKMFVDVLGEPSSQIRSI